MREPLFSRITPISSSVFFLRGPAGAVQSLWSDKERRWISVGVFVSLILTFHAVLVVCLVLYSSSAHLQVAQPAGAGEAVRLDSDVRRHAD
jgi:hypothetical protein